MSLEDFIVNKEYDESPLTFYRALQYCREQIRKNVDMVFASQLSCDTFGLDPRHAIKIMTLASAAEYECSKARQAVKAYRA